MEATGRHDRLPGDMRVPRGRWGLAPYRRVLLSPEAVGRSARIRYGSLAEADRRVSRETRSARIRLATTARRTPRAAPGPSASESSRGPATPSDRHHKDGRKLRLPEVR